MTPILDLRDHLIIFGSVDVTEAAGVMGVGVGEAVAILTKLALHGLVRELPDGRWTAT